MFENKPYHAYNWFGQKFQGNLGIRRVYSSMKIGKLDKVISQYWGDPLTETHPSSPELTWKRYGMCISVWCRPPPPPFPWPLCVNQKWTRLEMECSSYCTHLWLNFIRLYQVRKKKALHPHLVIIMVRYWLLTHTPWWLKEGLENWTIVGNVRLGNPRTQLLCTQPCSMWCYMRQPKDHLSL